MITNIEVDGFKSLQDFSVRLNQGLNVLVGPNGVGKTNIVLFFEFLSSLIDYSIGDAVSHVGGAGAIFQKIGSEDYAETIRGRVNGCHQIDRRRFVTYIYEFQIRISAEKDKVFYSHQEFKMRYTEKFIVGSTSNNLTDQWPFSVVQDTSDPNQCEISLLNFDRRKIKDRFPSFINTRNSKDAKMEFSKFLTLRDPAVNSIPSLLHPYVDNLFLILNDLRGGETFNVIPSKVREPEDSASTPGVRRDGSGLATTLFAIKRGTYAAVPFRPNRISLERSQMRRRFSPRIWHTIIRHLKNANATIDDLDVINETFDNKLTVKVTISSGEYRAVLPLSAMSDGTIKWLALITAILTSKSIFSIEEPENFLHPWMQAEVANIMREHIQAKQFPSFVLMTTHSESLLNYIQPEEVILVDLVNGKTFARRIKGIKAVKDAISNSGFGLGYFYFSNALSDA